MSHELKKIREEEQISPPPKSTSSYRTSKSPHGISADVKRYLKIKDERLKRMKEEVASQENRELNCAIH